MGLQAVSDSDFQEQVLDASATQPVLVDFWASWCNPCLMLAPVVEQLATDLHGEMKVTKLDVDANQRTMTQYGVQSIPTLILFRNGKELKRLVGFMPQEKLASEVKLAMAAAV